MEDTLSQVVFIDGVGGKYGGGSGEGNSTEVARGICIGIVFFVVT